MEEFFKGDVESLIAQIKQLTPNPLIKDPSYASYGFSLKTKQGEVVETGHKLFTNLFQAESWDMRLRLHHATGQMALNEGMPTTVYHLFHSYLRLGKQFAFAECLEAWVKGTEENRDLWESYQTSSEHIVSGSIRCGDRCVFRKTDFVKGKLLAITQESERQAQEAALLKEKQRFEAEEKRANEDLETLNKSRFDSFVYIMEDLRNGNFKIGRSKTPGKRERTLQSEVPEIVLRFSIPAHDDDERRLHGRFDPKRQRGEWFSLTPDELLWIISFLKKNGDVARVSANYEWVGKITLQASVKVGDE